MARGLFNRSHPARLPNKQIDIDYLAIDELTLSPSKHTEGTLLLTTSPISQTAMAMASLPTAIYTDANLGSMNDDADCDGVPRPMTG